MKNYTRIAVDFRPSIAECQPTPRFALVFHRYSDESSYDNEAERDKTALLVTRHAIRRTGQIAPGSLITHETVDEIMRLLSQQPRERRLLTPNVLLSLPEETLWYRPAQRRAMWIRYGKTRRALTVPWPALVFHARDGGLRIAALRAANKRPDENTRLYHAPLMNIYENGSLCLGNITPPSCGLSGMAAWEAAVYDTLFTHTNHRNTLRLRTKGKDDNIALYRFWHQLHKDEATRFPVGALVPRNETLGDWLDA